MRESTMVGKAEDGTFDEPYHVKVGSLGGQRHCGGGESRCAIESGTGENGAGQEMGEWFQENFVTQPSITWGQPPSAVLRSLAPRVSLQKAKTWPASPPGKPRAP